MPTPTPPRAPPSLYCYKMACLPLTQPHSESAGSRAAAPHAVAGAGCGEPSRSATGTSFCSLAARSLTLTCSRARDASGVAQGGDGGEITGGQGMGDVSGRWAAQGLAGDGQGDFRRLLSPHSPRPGTTRRCPPAPAVQRSGAPHAAEEQRVNEWVRRKRGSEVVSQNAVTDSR